MAQGHGHGQGQGKGPGPALRLVASAKELAPAAAAFIAKEAATAIVSRGVFRVALAGGATPLPAYGLLAEPPLSLKIPWEKVEIFFGDERLVPAGDPARNDASVCAVLLGRVPIRSENIHRVNEKAASPAAEYERQIRKLFSSPAPAIPVFDLVVLGIGSDGHTASLFPGHPALEVARALVTLVENAPKAPLTRVSFTLPLLAAARSLLFLVSGSGKRGAVAGTLRGDRSLPAALVAHSGPRALLLADREALTGPARPPEDR